MPKNIEMFANMMSDRMQQAANAAIPNTLELGIVNENMSITPDSFQVPIPQGDYMVNLRLTAAPETKEETHTHSGGGHGGHTGGDGSHSHSGGKHKHKLQPEYRGLQPGDRILIAWCGYEAVVISIVVSS